MYGKEILQSRKIAGEHPPTNQLCEVRGADGRPSQRTPLIRRSSSNTQDKKSTCCTRCRRPCELCRPPSRSAWASASITAWRTSTNTVSRLCYYHLAPAHAAMLAGHIYIGNHRDNPENQSVALVRLKGGLSVLTGMCSVIASLSLGAERSFVLSYAPLNKHPVARDYDDDDRPIVDDREPGASERKLKWDLANGSLLVMQGHTQHYWKHEIPKQPAIKHGRISLTFRQLENKK